MNNFKIAFRLLAKSPGFLAVAVLTLALGIGFSASSFSIANAFLLRDIPYPESERLIRIFRTSRQSNNMGHFPANALHIRENATSFTAIALYGMDNYALGESGRPAEQITALTATSEFFNVLGIQPSLGRGFSPTDDQPGQPRIAILTHRGWIRRFNGNPSVIGRQVRLNSELHTVVGVLPPTFEAPLVWGPVDFVVPRTIEPAYRTDRTVGWMQIVTRLKPGVSVRQAAAELDTIAARLAKDFPNQSAGDGLRTVELHVSNMDGVSRILMWLMTALSLTMLLIACANLASLQVARALGRSREFAVRAALGGSRRQLMLPLIAESILLSVAGGTLGLLVACWANDIVGSLLLINGEQGFGIPLDGRVIAFTSAAALFSGFAFGVAPAWLAARVPAAEALREGSRSSTGTPAHQRVKRTLIVTQIGLALALVGIAVSFGFGTKAFFRRPLGWQIDGLFAGYVSLPSSQYSDDAKIREFERLALERIAAIPGMQHVAIGTSVPVYSLGRIRRVIVEGQAPLESGREPTTMAAAVSSDYFSTLQIPLRKGALFPPTWKPGDTPVAIINESMARQLWPDSDPIGRRLRIVESEQWLKVIGVVADVKMAARPDAPETRLQLYRPFDHAPSRYLTIVARASTLPETLAAPIRQAVAAIDPDLPVTSSGSLRAETDRGLSNFNLVIANLGISAGMGLLIAAIGLFGVISQLTQQRTRDIGVRMALGAQSSDVLRMILGEGMRLLIVGIVVGVPLFFGLNFFVQRAMSGVVLPGVWLFGLNVVALSVTMLVACWLPARRATRINPVEALRSE